MFSNLMVGFLFGAGFGTWIYTRVMHSTGNNSKSSLLVGAIAGVFAMIAVIVLLNIFFKSS